jgi:hypothetical protein
LDSYAVESTDNIPQRRRRLSFGHGLAFTIKRFADVAEEQERTMTPLSRSYTVLLYRFKKSRNCRNCTVHYRKSIVEYYFVLYVLIALPVNK